jgi:carbon storage regulator CsrA
MEWNWLIIQPFSRGDSSMLVLTRKPHEVVMVGQGDGSKPLLKITVMAIENGKVRLGFEAAPDVAVHRLEVWERIHAFALDNPSGTVGEPKDPVLP